MNERKYLWSMFITGIIIYLLGIWYLPVLAILLYLVRLFIHDIFIWIVLFPLIIWIIWAISKQIYYSKAIIKMNPDDDLLNKMFLNNCKGYKNVIESVQAIIDKKRNDGDIVKNNHFPQ